jgi:hypothetical protein
LNLLRKARSIVHKVLSGDPAINEMPTSVCKMDSRN